MLSWTLFHLWSVSRRGMQDYWVFSVENCQFILYANVLCLFYFIYVKGISTVFGGLYGKSGLFLSVKFALIWAFGGIYTLDTLFAILFSKWDLLLTFLSTKPIQKKGLLLKERIYSLGGNSFLFEYIAFYKGGENVLTAVLQGPRL